MAGELQAKGRSWVGVRQDWDRVGARLGQSWLVSVILQMHRLSDCVRQSVCV